MPDEPGFIKQLRAQLPDWQVKLPAIEARAAALIEHIRKQKHRLDLEAFLKVYGLDTREGVAIMCLAEALLRIPDSATADSFIHDLFEGKDWRLYLHSSDLHLINASSWGLLLTGKIEHLEEATSLVPKLISKLGKPVIRETLKHAIKLIGNQFVLAETIEEALANSRTQEKAGYRFSYDMLGEGARNQAQADAYFEAYKHTIITIGNHKNGIGLYDAPSVSIKLSGLHPRYHLVKEKRLMAELLPRVKALVTLAMQQGITVSIDAEETTRLDCEIAVFEALFTDPAFHSYEGIGFVLQAYQKRAFGLIEWLGGLSKSTGRRMPVRLVKGAYWDSEIKAAQIAGLPDYPVFTRKEHTDISYLACAQKLLTHSEYFYPQFATHNALTAASVIELAEGKTGPFEFQRLHGMGESLHSQLIQQFPCRIYAPIGRHADLLAYLIRRLLENGANTSFVHLLIDKSKPLSNLLADPVTLSTLTETAETAIPLSSSLYPDRTNSCGFDLGSRESLQRLTTEMAAFETCFWRAGHTTEDRTPRTICNPADTAQITGYVTDSEASDISQATAKAHDAFARWKDTAVSERAHIVERFADLLETNRAEAMALLIREAGKTLPDAIGEVREAVDFCCYYALHARKLMRETVLTGPTGEHNLLTLQGRGIFACISPWNFPLSIFTGQIVAALVTGNCVIAKPAEQTPLIAAFAVKLLHEAGVPQNVLQLLPGHGETVGAELISNELIAGVVFTGSMGTARHINRALANRNGLIVPFIAETGGQNCMIVDSSALLEQVCDDVLLSAFGSAGQRCSALRVLYVQEDIAEQLLNLIRGAMQELSVGNPADPATDIGPVIDKQARNTLLLHIEKMKTSAALLATTPIDKSLDGTGTFVAPHMFEIQSITQLEGEIFGPVLHAIRFKASELDAVCAQINSTGYGLTFGLQSRLPHTIETIGNRIHAGNIYINRSMIGATVGVQPFGGHNLSGTGPKAGGPHYLERFVTEKTITVNSAAIGGNLELLTKKPL